MCSNCSLSVSSSREKPPRICDMAMRWVASLLEAMRSATASAWERSIFPARKALLVNSPGVAMRAPDCMSASIIFWTM